MANQEVASRSISSTSTTADPQSTMGDVEKQKGEQYANNQENSAAKLQNEFRTPLSHSISTPAIQSGLGLHRLVTGGSEIPAFSHALAHEKTTAGHIVDFDGPEDKYRPMNWPTSRKIKTTMIYGGLTATATWASSSYSAAIELIGPYFGVGTTVATLGISLFLLGFGTGPLLWAPLSEVYGRRFSVLVPMFIAVCFSFASATSKDLQTLMLTRFFTGFFSSAPVSNTGGVLADLFSPQWRGFAVAGYSLAVVDGALLAPIISAAAAHSYLGWRWTEYLTGILQACAFIVAVVFADESYAPVLLSRKAQRLRYSTGNWALHAKHEEWDVSVSSLVKKYLVRPMQLLATPICLFLTIYTSFIYGILYSTLGGIPIMFGEIRHFGPVTTELPFIALLIGSFIGVAINIYNQLVYNKHFLAGGGQRAVPERRLPPMMLGGIIFAAANFMVGWTSSPSVPWIVPCIGIGLFGTGFFTIFQASLLYLVDTFMMFSASAIAANTFMRCVVAAALPLVIAPLYHNLGVGPGNSIFGGIACLLVPVPWVFYFYGERIRASSKWSAKSVAPKPQKKGEV